MMMRCELARITLYLALPTSLGILGCGGGEENGSSAVGPNMAGAGGPILPTMEGGVAADGSADAVQNVADSATGETTPVPGGGLFDAIPAYPGRDAAANDPVDPRPAAPTEWMPQGATLGSPGWKQSTTPLCEKYS